MNKDNLKKICLISFPILIIVFIFIRFKYTFGSDTDWLAQHTIIPDYFRQMFYSTGKLIPNFAFNYGGGQNIYNFSYYGFLSPIILPSYLMPFMSMTTYMTLVDIFIVLISGILFNKWILSNKYNQKISMISSIIFILSESLLFQMHRHIMFVNYMPFLIMSLIGVDKFLKDNKKSFLVINIFLMIMTSYYYSVPGILVVGIYYIYKYLLINKKFIVKEFAIKIFKLICLIFVSVFMAGILLLPTIYVLFSGRGDSSNSINLINLLIPNLSISGVFSGTYTFGFSMLGFISLLYLFYTKKRENLVIAILCSILFFFPIFRFILNGGLYLREKCFIPFMPLIGLFITIFINDLFSNKINIKNLLKYILIITVPLYLFNKMSISYIYLIFIVGLLIYYDKTKNIKMTSYALIIVAFFICLVSNLIEDYVSLSDYNKYFNKKIDNEIQEILNIDNGIYRMNNLMYLNKTVNKIYDYKYYTPNIYTSTYNKYYLSFIRDTFKLNNPDFNYFFISAPNNLLFNTYMGVKYLYSDYDIGLGYNKIGKNIYVNNNVYPLVYVNNKIMSEKEFDLIDYPYNLELLLNNVIVNKENINTYKDSNIEKIDLNYTIDYIGKNIKIDKNDNQYKITVKENDKMIIKLNKPFTNKLLFINLFGLNRNSCKNGNTYIKINNQENLITCSSWIYHNQNENFHYLISDQTIDELVVEFGKGTYNISNIELFTLNYDIIKDLNTNLKNVNDLKISEDKISCSVNISDNNYLVTSIPYDKGFTIKVNNKIVEGEIVNKAFLGIPLKPGNYNIEITYQSPLLKEGKYISIIGFISLIGLIILDKKNEKK